MFTGSGIIWRFRENNNFGQFWPLCEIFLWGNAIFSSQYKTFPRPFLALIPKMELKFCSDFLKWSKIDHFWLLPENSENPNFWLWAFISQNRKRFISYEYYFVHIQSICYNLTYRVFNGSDLCFILTWPHLISFNKNRAIFQLKQLKRQKELWINLILRFNFFDWVYFPG